MRNFNLGPVSQWRQISTGEVLDFPTPPNAPRKVAFDIVADSHVTVSVIAQGNNWLVGAGDGQLSISFVIDEPVGVVVMGDQEAEVFIKTRVGSQVIPESRDPSYVTIEPRPAGPSQEVRQMMHIVKINQQRREQALLDEMARLRKDVQPKQQVIEPDPQPDPEPDPEPEGDSDES